MAAVRVFSFTKGIYSAELLQVVKVDNKSEEQEGIDGVFLTSVWKKANLQLCSFFLIAEK